MNLRYRAKGWRGLLLALAIFAAVWCVQQIQSCGSKSDNNGEPTVTVSFAPQEWIVRGIAGNDFAVNTLVKPGTDPETYDPTVGDLSATARSKVWLAMGTQGFEEAIAENAKSSFPDLKRVDCSVSIEKIKGTHGGEETDPHLWSSPRNMRAIAAVTLRELIALRPDRKQAYEEAARKLDLRLTALDDSIRRIVGESGNRTFAIQHPSLSYLARDYGLTQMAFETEGKETTPRQMRERIDKVREARPAVMFFETEHNPEQSLQIASQIGVRAVEISLNTTDWPTEMMKIANAFRKQQ